jgi:parvulin-like peptidyl-prolyl isomerase
MNSIIIKILLFTVYCSLFTVFVGCATFLQKEDILAVVDGEPITIEDMKYSLQIAHRREDLSSAKDLNISQYIQKLIDERLIIQEARRMGLEQDAEIQEKIRAYILRESVVRLYNEEIVQKVSVSEKDVLNYYKKNYERFILSIIETNSEKDAREILEQLKKGENLNNNEVILTRRSMRPYIEKVVSTLNPGEFSEVIKRDDRYLIVKLIDRQEALNEEFEDLRESIEQAVRKQKEKKRSDRYLEHLREQASIKINREILSAIRLDQEGEEREKWLKDESPIAQVNESILTVKDFIAMASTGIKKSKEEILNNWIDRKLVDQEALSRHYEREPEFKNRVKRYEDQLLKRKFIEKVIIPQIKISDKELKDYYLTHQEDFVKPVLFKIQQITVKTMNEAKDVLNSLQNGADFSWLAKRRSIDSVASLGGTLGWYTKAQLSEPIREIIDTLKPGDISPILEIDSLYKIIRLQERTKREFEEFDKVKESIYRAVFRKKIKEIYNKYVAQLREEAEVKIHNETVQSFKEMLKQKED